MNIRVFVQATLGLLCGMVLFFVSQGSAKAQGGDTQGLPPFNTTSKGIDNINLGSLDTHIEIPLFQKPGRGSLNTVVSLVYDTPSVYSAYQVQNTRSWINEVQTGWSISVQAPSLGWLDYRVAAYPCINTSSGGVVTEEEYDEEIQEVYTLYSEYQFGGYDLVFGLSNDPVTDLPATTWAIYMSAGDDQGDYGPPVKSGYIILPTAPDSNNSFNYYIYSLRAFVDSHNTAHPILGNLESDIECTAPSYYGLGLYPSSLAEPDGYGNNIAMNVDGSAVTYTISDVYGNSNTVDLSSPSPNTTPTTLVTDRYGNSISSVWEPLSGVFGMTYTDATGAKFRIANPFQSPNTVTSGTAVVSYTDTLGNPQSTFITFSGGVDSTYDSSTQFYNGGRDAMPTSVTYADGSSYTFSYEGEGNTVVPGGYTGRLASITLPTGGTISYDYPSGAFSSVGYWQTAVLSGVFYAYPRSLKRTTPDGTTTYTTTYAASPCSAALGGANLNTANTWITDAQGNRTSVTLAGVSSLHDSYPGPSSYVETSRSASGGYSVNYEKFYNGYSDTLDPDAQCLMTPIYGVAQASTITQVKEEDSSADISGLFLSPKTTTYANGLVTEVDESDLTDTVIRKTKTTYGAYGQPSDITVTDGSDNTVAETGYGFDGSGNQTDIYQHINTSTNSSTTHVHKTYYPNGLLASMTDASNTNTTAYSYDTSGFLSKVSPPTINGTDQSVSYIYDDNLGVPLKITDANGKMTTYTYDSLGRVATVGYPDGGNVTYTRASGTGNYVEVADSASDVTTSGDGMGRTVTASDYYTNTKIDTTYDSLGRIQSVSNPYYYFAAASTDGITQFQYNDTLGRKTLQTHPDTTLSQGASGNLSWMYDAHGDSTFQDENGNSTSQTLDALGRLISVVDAGGNNTTYSYDTLGNLLCVDQWGTATPGTNCSSARARTFTYDALSRLVCASNPETGSGHCPANAVSVSSTTGVTLYTYDNNGNLLSKTSPLANASSGTQTIAYKYDALNRLIQKGYPVGSNYFYSCYQYDITSNSAASTPGNFIGRLTNSWTQISSSSPSSFTCPSYPASPLSRRSVLAYDSMGRLLSEQQCTKASCAGTVYTPSFTYDTAGNVLAQTSGISSGPGSFTFTNSYYGHQLASVTSDKTSYPLFSANFVSYLGNYGAFPTSSASYCGNGNFITTPAETLIPYSSGGGLLYWTLGNGLQMSRSYDKRFRVNCERDFGNLPPTPASGSAAIVINGRDQP